MYKHVFLVTGFLQPYLFRKGLIKLYDELSKTDVHVNIYRWHQLDKIINRLSAVHPDSEIIFAGLSYGVSTIVFACDHIKIARPDLRVKHLVSADGIWRPDPYYPSFKSLYDGQEINVPNNVDNVHIFVQKRGILQGHKINVEPPTQIVIHEVVKDFRHIKMDEYPEFMNTVLKLAHE